MLQTISALAGLIVAAVIVFGLSRLIITLARKKGLTATRVSKSWTTEEKSKSTDVFGTSSFRVVLDQYHVFHVAVIALPQLGMLQNLALSRVFHWEEVTTATCDWTKETPKNLLPSISACIGHSALNRQIWGMYIGTNIGLRLPSILVFLFAFAPSLWNGSLRPQVSQLLRLKALLHLFEQIGLLGLTVVTSSENLLVHQIYFVIYWLASIGCLSITTWINFQATKPGAFSGLTADRVRFTLRWRLVCLGIHLFSSGSALGWYFAHETYCTDYFYTLFALSEWTLVFSNIYFHLAETFEAVDLTIAVQRELTGQQQGTATVGSASLMELRRVH